jgi:hypothetical protein
MSGWADNLADLSAACTSQAAFGELVTLPSGAIVSGVFDLPGPEAGGFGTDVGRLMRLGDQPNPSLYLAGTDAAALAEGDTLTVRGLTYTVTRIHQADSIGLVLIDLMPTAANTALGLRYR